MKISTSLSVYTKTDDLFICLFVCTKWVIIAIHYNSIFKDQANH